MYDQEMVTAIAKEMYRYEHTIFAWDKEQDHLRWSYINRAETVLEQIGKAGYVVVNKPQKELKVELDVSSGGDRGKDRGKATTKSDKDTDKAA